MKQKWKKKKRFRQLIEFIFCVFLFAIGKRILKNSNLNLMSVDGFDVCAIDVPVLFSLIKLSVCTPRESTLRALDTTGKFVLRRRKTFEMSELVELLFPN